MAEKTLMNYDWNNIVSSARNEIVFEGRNKSYGAYDIRKNYTRSASMAFWITVISISVVIAMPVIIDLIKGLQKEEVKKTTEVVVNLIAPPPIDDAAPPPPPPPPPPKVETVKFTPPKIVDKVVEDEPPPQEKLVEAPKIGQENIHGDTVAEAPPDVAIGDTVGSGVYTFVEEQAGFPGGEAERMAYLKKNIHYPVIAKENGIQGTVWLQFVIDREGKISDAKVVRGIGGGCDEEALRVVKGMPGWKPGKQNGHAVKCLFSMPINFKLQ